MSSDRAWRADAGTVRVPVARPMLPTADALVPYLREIDARRYYSNGGPLAYDLERRLAQRYGTPEDGVVTVANATLGLTLVLAASSIPARTLCMVPAWTFSASAHAIVLAGLVPWIVDVDARDWALTPELARHYASRAPGVLGAVMPVLPFGAPVDVAGWERFRNETGCAVVFDAAAAFDALEASEIPAVVSLHATKVLGAGEGGFVVCRDETVTRDVRRASNFGIYGDREAKISGTNAKLSEYGAAVALASYDGWNVSRRAFASVAAGYVDAFAGSAVGLQRGFGTTWVSSTCNVMLPPQALDAVEDALEREGFGSRRWWGDGVAAHRAFAACPREDLPNAQRLAKSVLGLPLWMDLLAADVRAIADVVKSGSALAGAAG